MYEQKTVNGANSDNQCVLVPLADIYETADNYTLKLEMPGVTRDKLDITIEKDELEIKGDVEAYKSDNKELKYSEFSQYNYFRRFNIGADIDRNTIGASLENGVLTLILQKLEEVKPKKIQININ